MTSSRRNPERAVFLDRDGVINEDKHYVFRLEDLVILPGVGAALRALQDRGYALVVVSNQAGVARGYFSLAQAEAFNAAVGEALKKSHGIEFVDLLFCPYHTKGTVPEFTKDSDWRKPNPGMLLEAAQRHGLDLTQSYMIGDKHSDIECAVRAGVKGIQVSRNQVAERVVGAEFALHPCALAHVRTLEEAVRHVP